MHRRNLLKACAAGALAVALPGAAHGRILAAASKPSFDANVIGDRTKTDWHTVYGELKANLVPGVILQPTGVYAVHRAQEAGCTYCAGG